MHNFTPQHTALMVVAPQQSASIGSGSVAAGGGAGLARVVGGLGMQQSTLTTRFDRLVHVASTVSFARTLDQKYGLMKQIYGASLDESSGEWIRPGGREFEIRERINSYLNLPTWTEPTIEDLSKFLGSRLKVKGIPNTPFKRIAVTDEDPERALMLLKLIYKEASEFLRQQSLAELDEQRGYLEERLRSTTVLELRTALVGLLADQARREMMLQGNLPFVARITDPPHISKYKTTPDVLVSVGFPILAMTFIGIGIIVLVAVFRSE